MSHCFCIRNSVFPYVVMLMKAWKWKSLSRVGLFETPWTIQSIEFSRPEYWSGDPFPSPGDLPNPEIEPRFPALQVNSSPAEPQGKPKNTGVGSLSLLHWIFLTQKSKQGLLHFRRILYQLSYQGSPNEGLTGIKIKSMPERISQHCFVFYVYFCKLPHNILLILFFVLQLVFFQ